MSNDHALIVNALDADKGEIRIADVRNQQLKKVYEQNESTIINKGNIYWAKIKSDVPSLEAYFVDYGEEKHGFLPYKETIKDPSSKENKKYSVNDQLLVQISKEERGNKGAALTGEVTIPGTFLVLLPFSTGVKGISKNIEEKFRTTVENNIKNLDIDPTYGVIARTSSKNRNINELNADLKYLVNLWQEINDCIDNKKENQLLFQEHQGIYKLIKESVNDKTSRIVVDHEPTAEIIKKYAQEIYPQLVDNILVHNSNVPIFTHFQIEDSIEAMYSREVSLQSGGKIVIDKTEAMYTIDVNSAQATNANNVEKTALQTNIEAVRKVAQILELREINGIIAIDLIDMSEEEHKQLVINEMRKSVVDDKSRVAVVGEISELGVLQLSRQRSKPSLAETHLTTCSTCNGRGYVRSPISFVYSLIHIIEQHAIHGKLSTLIVQAPLNVATYLCNEKYSTIRAIEERQKVFIKIIPNPNLEIPKYLIKRIRREDTTPELLEVSAKEEDISKSLIASKKLAHKAALTNRYTPDRKSNVGIIQKICELFSNSNKEKEPKNNKQKKPANNSKGNRSTQNKKGNSNNNQRRRAINNRRGPNTKTKRES